MLTDLVLTLVLIGIDQLTKFWAVNTLAAMPGGIIPVIGGVLNFVYAENTGADVSFLRGRSAAMLIVRLLQIALAVYLLVRHREKLAKITRIALCLFLAGLIGNQINYLLFDYVPDMIHLPFLGGVIFNVADIWAFAAMVVLFVRLAFFEGRDFVDWLGKKLTPKKGEPEQGAKKMNGAPQSVVSGDSAGKGGNPLPQNCENGSGEANVPGK